MQKKINRRKKEINSIKFFVQEGNTLKIVVFNHLKLILLIRYKL